MCYMKGITVIILSMLCIMFCGCMRDITTQREFNHATTAPMINEMESMTEKYDYTTIEKSDIQSEYTYSTVDINIPEYATLTDYCVSGNLVYFSYNYLDYFYQNGMGDNMDMYKNNICVYDMESGISEIIYTIPNSTEYIQCLDCNGEYLMFVQDVYMALEPDKQVFLMDLSQDVLQEVSVPLDTDASSIGLIDGYIVWKAQGEEYQGKSIYRYDYTTGETVELIKNIYANSFQVNRIDKIISVCNILEDDRTNIMAYDFEGNLVNNYVVDGYIVDGECNSWGVVWLQNHMMFFYDFSNDEVIGLDYAKSYELVNDAIISMSNDGIYSYRFGDTYKKYILKTEEDYGIGFNNTNGKIYGKWYILGQYGMPWDEDVVTILQIPIIDM